MSIFNKLAAREINGITPTLCEIEHGGETLCFTDNGKSVIWNGKEYTPCVMKIKLPESGKDSDGTASLEISAINRGIMQVIRLADEAPQFTIRAMLVENPLGDEPIITELDGYTFLLKDITGVADNLSCKLATALLIGLDFPRWIGNNVNLRSIG